MSASQDLVTPETNNHQHMVAYLAFRIAERMNVSKYVIKEIFLASLIHDIGTLSEQERADIVMQKATDRNTHAYRGAYLFKGFKPFENISLLIKYHHTPWNGGNMYGIDNETVPFESNIINAADYVCSSISARLFSQESRGPYDRFILNVMPDVVKKVSENKGDMFAPEIIEALNELFHDEYIWLDLVSDNPVSHVPEDVRRSVLVLDADDVIEIARIFSHIIDFRSEFTSRHSAGVAAVAEYLASRAGFSPVECKLMLVAGYLHDLGKLAISSDILEKPGKLEPKEMRVMKSHTYFTYKLLERVPEMQIINEWASYHHERLDGKGYPFKIKGDHLMLGSRIMAIADIFTAITEHRPYRAGMEDENAMRVLESMRTSGAIDPDLTLMVLKDFQQTNAVRAQAQDAAAEAFSEFQSKFP